MSERTMELTGKFDAVNVDFITGAPKVTFTVNEKAELMQGYDDLKNVELLAIEVKPYRKKRSLNANCLKSFATLGAYKRR